MGFDHRTPYPAQIPPHGSHRLVAEDLIWCAVHCLTYVKEQVRLEDIIEQIRIKKRMEFHLRQNHVPNRYKLPPGAPRWVFWIMTIISRRYDFIFRPEENLSNHPRLMECSKAVQ